MFGHIRKLSTSFTGHRWRNGSDSALCSRHWRGQQQEHDRKKRGGEENMKCYTVSIYLSIAVETEEEAREIAFNLEVVPKNEADEGKIFWNSQNTEVEEEAL
jgi:hypothetical protein